MQYDWVGNYVTALTNFGWSEDEFWKSTPRKFYAFLFTYAKLKEQALKPKPQEVLVGKQALQALSSIASRCSY